MASPLEPWSSGAITLDTNIFLRFLTQDDLDQSAEAERFMSGLTSVASGYVGREILAEMAKVLERAYKVHAPTLLGP
ncbi:hypothetical protein [Roseivivax sp. THAF197b]|uniref:hypothetical protein n=1 Tax=Roseivivax sp. THAF197b TaxID=2588299 RepID=UPI0012A9BCDB|nr:hypothetical protein [Roseivivax sp. THAF197b]QFS84801.1 hypothetical protein FIV09_18320 [Roseivivax sp. THAF197b]